MCGVFNAVLHWNQGKFLKMAPVRWMTFLIHSEMMHFQCQILLAFHQTSWHKTKNLKMQWIQPLGLTQQIPATWGVVPFQASTNTWSNSAHHIETLTFVAHGPFLTHVSRSSLRWAAAWFWWIFLERTIHNSNQFPCRNKQREPLLSWTSQKQVAFLLESPIGWNCFGITITTTNY